MYHRSHHYNKQRGEIDHRPITTTTMSTLSTFTSTAITISPALADVFSRQIEMSKIETSSDPCECEVKHCPQKCFTALVSGTTTALATTRPTTTATSSTFNNITLPENSKESQLLVNSYPHVFQSCSLIIFFVTKMFIYKLFYQ